jgi:hypothetical protein
MTANEYLERVLAGQTLDEDGDELKDLRKHRAAVDKVLLDKYSEASPTLRYGGSKAKGTMIKSAYDLDIICYFPNDSTEAGDTLEEIHSNVKKTLESNYAVEPKGSALRLKGKGNDFQVDFHVDVIPGRFVDESKSDAFLYQPSGEKKRLKTNLQVHIDHVRDSRVREAIRLIKLWRYHNGIQFKHFVLELLVIKLLKTKTAEGLDEQLTHVWTEFRDESESLSVQDPANPNGNDLSGALDSVRSLLSLVAGTTLSSIENSGWEAVFGKIEDDGNGGGAKLASLQRAAAVITRPSKPWLDIP